MEYKDYYAILGVDKKASEDDIKKSYRRLARKYHPDVSKEKNAEEKFKELQEAYEVLKDPEKRSAYDQLGSNWKQGQEFRPPPGWDGRTQFRSAGNGGFSESDMSGFSDFFANIFGRARAHGQQSEYADDEFQGFQDFQQRGSDQHAKIQISLKDAFRGVTKMLSLQTPTLDASGKLHQSTRTIKVNIPAGALQGQQLRLAKQGNPGMGGAPAGDLYLEIDIQPNALFSLQGADVYLTLPITPWEAALGADIKIPTLAGYVGLKLAPNSKAGQKLRLKGRGMPSKQNAGDQYAILQIETPPANTSEQKELYEKMSQVMSFNPRKNWPSE